MHLNFSAKNNLKPLEKFIQNILKILNFILFIHTNFGPFHPGPQSIGRRVVSGNISGNISKGINLINLNNKFPAYFNWEIFDNCEGVQRNS